MASAWFHNLAQVPIGGKKPTQRFLLPVSDDGQPLDQFWRNRLEDGSVAPVSDDTPEPAAPVDPPAASAEAARTAKKGR